MSHKRFFGLAAMILLFTFPLSASMVSFLVVETGLPEGAVSLPYTGLWEGGLMDVFFDAGHIVTNSPAARIEKRPARDLSGLLEDDYRAAVSGGAEYFILAYLDFSRRGERAVPVTMTLKLYKTDSQKLIFEQNFAAGSGKDNNEEYKIAQNAGRTIIQHLKER